MPQNSTEAWSRLAVELSNLAGTAERLLLLHVDNGSGLCCACTRPGTGLAGSLWPCPLHQLASRAISLRQRGRTTPNGHEGRQRSLL